MKIINYDNQNINQIEYFDFLINNLNVHSLIHGHSTLKRDWIHKNISSPFHRLYFILGGSGTIKNKNRTVSLLPGHVYLIPANSEWSYSCENEMEQFFLHIKINLMNGLDVFQDVRQCLVLSYPEEDIKAVVGSVESGSLGDIVKFKSFLFNIISRLIIVNHIELIPQIEKTLKYQELFQYLQSNNTAELKVSQVVDFMKKSHSALYKDLKEDTGYSIKYYINKNLIDASCELLLLTDLSVKQIANKLDFKDQYYFSRFFKKMMGISPSIYRSYNNP